MSGFYLVASLLLLILTTGRMTVGNFLFELKNNMQRKLAHDVFLGETAEGIARAEQFVTQNNQRLHEIHKSCTAILLLPPPAMLEALRLGKLAAKSLRIAQDARRLETKTRITVARQRGYRVDKQLSHQRLNNACGFDGPLETSRDSNVRITNADSGVRISISSYTTWTFAHPKSRSAWF